MNRARVIDAVVVSGASRDVGGYDDDVYLAEISSEVKRFMGVGGEDLLRETLSVVEEILSSGLMTVGDIVATSDPLGASALPNVRFVSWRLAIPDVLSRIEREWRILGRDPSVGDICWFNNTPAGNERAQRSVSSLSSRTARGTTRRKANGIEVGRSNSQPLFDRRPGVHATTVELYRAPRLVRTIRRCQPQWSAFLSVEDSIGSVVVGPGASSKALRRVRYQPESGAPASVGSQGGGKQTSSVAQAFSLTQNPSGSVGQTHVLCSVHTVVGRSAQLLCSSHQKMASPTGLSHAPNRNAKSIESRVSAAVYFLDRIVTKPPLSRTFHHLRRELPRR